MTTCPFKYREDSHIRYSRHYPNNLLKFKIEVKVLKKKIMITKEEFEFINRPKAMLKYLEIIEEQIIILEEGISREEAVKKANLKKIGYFEKLFEKAKELLGPRSEESSLEQVRKINIPFWYISGSFQYKWLNITNYPFPVPEDTEAIKIEDKIYLVRKEALKISDMAKKLGIDVSIGPISVPTKGAFSFLKLLGKDKTIGSTRHILLENVKELRKNKLNKKICIDAKYGEKNEEVLNLIEKTHSQSIEKDEMPAIKKEWAVKKFFEIEFGDINKYIEGEAERIMERIVKINEIKLVLVPYYEFLFKKDDKIKDFFIRAVDGKFFIRL